MKNMYLFLIVLLLSSTSLFAQKQGISIGGNVYFPVGDWSDYANTGFGGSASYEHQLSKEVAGVIYTGYTSFSSDVEGSSWTVVPLLAGAKFYFTPKWDWYIAALLGVDFVTADVSTTIQGQLYESSASSTEFAGNINFGYEVQTSEKGAVDISAGFVYVDQLSYFGMRLAYIFRL
jgi:hypothetical protein